MPDRPIIFSGPMVRALLAGRKTMTRRVLKPAPGDMDRPFQMDDGSWHVTDSRGGNMSPLAVRYAVGDRLWVREAWKSHSTFADLKPRDIPVSRVFYRADDGYAPSNTPWRLSIHMPRWASRLTLTVTEVKVERLQDISEDDAEADGLARGHAGGPWGEEGLIDDFADLWNSLHGPGAWDANPWVAAIRFTVERGNIDALAPRPTGPAA